MAARPNAFWLVGMGWKSAAEAIFRGPAVFLLAVLFLVALTPATTWVARFLPNVPFLPPLAEMFGWMALTSFIANLPLAITAVAVHRFILLGEMPSLRGVRIGRVCWFALALTVFFLALMAINLLLIPKGFALANFVAALAYVFLTIRLVLMFPGIAVGDAEPIDGSWEKTEGQFWRLFFALLIGVTPLVLLQVASGIGMLLQWALTRSFMSWQVLGSTAFGAVLSVIETAVAAAIASRVYKEEPLQY